MDEVNETCRYCWRSHDPEEYACSACHTRFPCPSLTVALTLGTGAVLRGHVVVVRLNMEVVSSDACGPVLRYIPVDAAVRERERARLTVIG